MASIICFATKKGIISKQFTGGLNTMTKFFETMKYAVLRYHLDGYLPRKGNVVVIFQTEDPLDLSLADIFTSASEEDLTDEIGRRAGIIKSSEQSELWVTTMSELSRAQKEGRLARLLQVTSSDCNLITGYQVNE